MTRLFPLGCLTAIVLAACGGATSESAAPKTTTTESASPSTGGEARIREALAGPQRPDKEKARDIYRHPAETLAFFGVKPESKVVELWPGGGWYTAVLAPVVRGHGKLTVTSADPAVATGFQKESAEKYAARLRETPAAFDQVEVRYINAPSVLTLGPEGSADVVLTFRNVHNWMKGGFADKVFAAAFQVLKKGGVLGVEEHRAPAGTTTEKSIETGYVTEDTVIQFAKAAGFVLDAKSEVNANPKDTKDYPKGVWTLPPTLQLGDEGREKYLAIGESDRMTLRFKKP
ncbi:methyltransferase [Pendulispora rubella]|uniref:Methyltransferase n=1 Tax=Pendulispora rubella TaxID=2741070 RepID=A0ABZ2LLL6_9BACT